jgi:hypothetical protein
MHARPGGAVTDGTSAAVAFASTCNATAASGLSRRFAVLEGAPYGDCARCWRDRRVRYGDRPSDASLRAECGDMGRPLRRAPKPGKVRAVVADRPGHDHRCRARRGDCRRGARRGRESDVT